MRIIYVKNISGSIQTWIKEFAIDEEYQLQTTSERESYAGCNDLLTAIGNGDAAIGNGEEYFSTVENQLNWLMQELTGSDSEQEAIELEGDVYTSWVPDVSSLPSGNKARATFDYSGNMHVRSQVLTDERSFRDDFSGSSFGTTLTGSVTFENGSTTVIGSGTAFTEEVIEGDWVKKSVDDDIYFMSVESIISDTELILTTAYLGTSGTDGGQISSWGTDISGTGTVAKANSIVTATNSVTSGHRVVIENLGDYGPIIGANKFKIRQRVANQTTKIGFIDQWTSENKGAYFLFDGTSNTTIKCVTRSSNNANDVETTTLTLPADVLTSDYHVYKIEVKHDKVAFSIDDSINISHQTHIPGPYDSMNYFLGTENTGTVGSQTLWDSDFVDVQNIDEVQSTNAFKSQPTPTYQSEDIHVLYGKKTSTTATVDQEVISYTVPTGKVLYLLNYSLEQTSSVTTIGKVGKNTVTTEPAAPGIVDGNILRVFRLNSSNPPASSVRETFSIPLRFARGGDVIKLTVSPSAGTTTDYRASIDFLLR